MIGPVLGDRHHLEAGPGCGGNGVVCLPWARRPLGSCQACLARSRPAVVRPDLWQG
jgi:hypothetical protein